jgi:single-stranded-DNA-specific exonuclease
MAEPDSACVAEVSDALSCTPVVGRVLVNRGMQTAAQALSFYDPSCNKLHDPLLLDDMDIAVGRLRQAIEHRERILVFGDYDVDGMSATALLVRVLDTLGSPTYYYIPNRLVEGYGLNAGQVMKAHDEGVGLIVTVDNGIACHEEIELASRLGIDVIVCDHHEPEGTLPEAFAVLNPKREDSAYPFRDLSGVGVAFKLATALLEKLPRNLDFAALGTIADIVPLLDENRILAKAGLGMMNDGENLSPGLAELCKVSGIEGRQITSGNVAFQLAPRLNASGRLGCGHLGVQLLLTTSRPLAQRLARKLDEENRSRQVIESEILEQALAKMATDFDPQRDLSIVLSDSRWHPGVAGIVASKLVEMYHRPVILVSMGEEIGKGSARSIPNFHIYEALGKCQEHLVSFGGHKYAAGLTVHPSKFDAYRSAFESVCRERLSPEDLLPVARVDAEVRLPDVTTALLKELETLAPHGNANPVPVFASMGVTVVGGVRVLRGGHLKFSVKQGGKTLPVIGFKMEEYTDLVTESRTIDILYNPQFNTYREVTSIQLSLRDIRPHES